MSDSPQEGPAGDDTVRADAVEPERRFKAPEIAEAFAEAREEVRRRREDLARDPEGPDDDYIQPTERTWVEFEADDDR